MEAGNTFELEYWSEQKLVIGLDEAGRGPLAGPVVVAGVVFPKGYHHDGINDSKKVSDKKRRALYEIILHDALAYCICIVDRKRIDEVNIYRATQEAMQRCVNEIGIDIAGVLSDAMPLPECSLPVNAIIKGDSKSISIAAASILAKVTRDCLMEDYDLIYPGYDFSAHKGYGTKKHLEAIDKLGICPIHRHSFEPIKSMVEPNLFTLD